jgi:hypothetical protein
MNGDQPVSWLMFFTLIAGAVIVCGFFLNFIRSRHNREIAENTLAGDGRSRGVAPSGAGPEIIAVGVFAILAMGLLAFANSNRTDTMSAQAPQPAGQTTGKSGALQAPGSFNDPKPYQPANPATDQRVSPTGSNAGVGASPGNTGTLTK